MRERLLWLQQLNPNKKDRLPGLFYWDLKRTFYRPRKKEIKVPNPPINANKTITNPIGTPLVDGPILS
jgi:hypothetical protein